MKISVFHKILERFGQLGADEVQNYLQRLAREQGFLETIFNSIHEGIIVTDRGDLIQYYNPAAARMLGLGESGALGSRLGKYVKNFDLTKASQRGDAMAFNLEISYPEKRCLNVNTIPLGIETSDTCALALILQDITEQVTAAREAAETERIGALSQIAASVAHELGNPLNSFTIQIQLMERELAKLPSEKTDKFRKALDISRSELTRLDGIIKQFLRSIRPSEPHMRLLPVNEVLRESLAFLHGEIEDRDLKLEVRLDETLPAVMLDPDQIKQVFYNLIRNSMQAMRSGGKLQVGTTSKEGGVLVVFGDTGAGMTPEEVSRLFEPYYTTKKDGTGLGLLISRRIVREHGGELNIQSQPDKGTRVTLWLPLPGARIKMLEN